MCCWTGDNYSVIKTIVVLCEKQMTMLWRLFLALYLFVYMFIYVFMYAYTVYV